MGFLDLTYLGNDLRSWALALVVAAALLFGLRVARGVLVRRLRKLAGRTATGIDDLGIAILESIRPFFLFFVSVYAAAHFVVLPETVRAVLRALTVIAVLLQGGIAGSLIIRTLIATYSQRRLQEDAAAATTMGFLGFIGRVGLWVLLLLVALDSFGFDITALVAGLGIGGVAVALALQNVLGDLFASLSIVLDRPFVIGDFIIVGDLMGTVEHIGLKTTRVRSLSGEQLVFSNGDLLGSRIRNFKRMRERRVVFTIGVRYETPREKLEAIPVIIRRAIEAQDQTRFDRAHFAAYGDFSLDFEVVYYVLVPDYNTYMDIQQSINLALLREFEREGIRFAYPTRTVLVRRETQAGAAVPAGGTASG